MSKFRGKSWVNIELLFGSLSRHGTFHIKAELYLRGLNKQNTISFR